MCDFWIALRQPSCTDTHNALISHTPTHSRPVYMHTQGPLFVYAGILSNRVSGGYTGGGKQGLRVECQCSSSPICLLGALAALHRHHGHTGDGGGSPLLL